MTLSALAALLSPYLVPGGLLALSPLIGWLAMRLLSAAPVLALLGQSLRFGKGLGATLASLPKHGAFRLLFGPIVYLLVYGIAFLMSIADGILSNTDPEIKKLTDALIAALEKAGAGDRLLYLKQKDLPGPAAEAVRQMQDALRQGSDAVDAAQVAVIAHELALGNETQADRLKTP